MGDGLEAVGIGGGGRDGAGGGGRDGGARFGFSTGSMPEPLLEMGRGA